MAEWHAKPSGGYYYGSGDGLENVKCINGFFNSQGYTLESQAGIIGNMYHESALNPWRWQSDTVNYGAGYGLFQFTPASDYFNYCTDVMGFAPNRSVTEVTSGAAPWDGYAQLIVMHEDRLNKWVPYCWRDYWSISDYPNLWEMRNRIIAEYGSNGGLTLAQFQNIANVDWATFAFLACYEGPGAPNFTVRRDDARTIYTILSGEEPPVPPGPEPPGPTPGQRKSKVMFYLKPYWKRGF